MDSSKKPRILYQTPVHAQQQRPPATLQGTPTALAGSTQTGDILDYLKGRGGRIKELEDAVTDQRMAKEQLASQLQHAEQRVRMLEQRLEAVNAATAEPPTVYIAELEKLVSDQLQRVLQLEQALAVAREQLAATQVTMHEAQAALAAARDQAQRTAAQGELAIAALQQELALLRSEHVEQRERAERAAKVEAAQAAAAAQVHQATAAALRDAEERLSQRDMQLTALANRLPAAAAGSSELCRLQERVHALEAALTQRDVQSTGQLEALRSELADAKRRETAARVAGEAAAERASTAEARVRRLEAEADSLAREVAGLQEKLGRGEFGAASGMRVLHMRMNPEAEYHKQAAKGQAGVLQAQVDALTSSLEQAQAALSAMEARAVAAEAAAATAITQPGFSSVAGAGAAAPAAGGLCTAELMLQLAHRDAEVAVLRHKQMEADKALARLKAIFKERTAVFREAMYCLFGYRVDMASEATTASAAATAVTTFSLRPQHADSPEDLLAFRYTPEGGMQLVPTTFTTNRLAREVDTFVHRYKCIPALTANLTIESFQKQTQC